MSHEVAAVSNEDTVLRVMADVDARAILAATAERPLSVSEVAERLEIPTSTVYRKVGELVDAELLDERVRIQSTGQNISEYTPRAESIDVSISVADTLEVNCSITTHAPERPDVPAPTVSTDGGETTVKERSDERHRQLQSIFEDVTGAEEVVEKQDSAAASRHIDDGEEQSISEYLTTVARDDGLSDTISEPELSGDAN